MNQLQVFENELFKVSAKTQGDQILFDVEQVAKSLGITDKKNDSEYVRWRRVNSYLPANSPQVAKGDFIPEPLVYKLAFKASNEVAEKFQDWLAIEVIPSIRKHGAYMTPEKIEEALLNPDTIIKLATELKTEQHKRMEAEETIELQKPKVVFAEAYEVSEDLITIKEMANLLRQKGLDTGEKRLYTWLRENGYVCKKVGSMYNLPTQRSLDLGILEIKKGIRTGTGGAIRQTRTTKVTGKGQVYFVNKLLPNKEVI